MQLRFNQNHVLRPTDFPLTMPSDGLIDSTDFAPIVDDAVANGETVNILTGVHGTPTGGIIPEPKFYVQDVDQFGDFPNVNVMDMNKMTLDEINDVAKGADTTIGAFCFSGSASCTKVD